MDEPTLRALGMTRRQLSVALGRGVVVAVPGVALAVAIGDRAVAADADRPRPRAETDPGFAIDPIVLGIGAAVVLAVVFGSVFLGRAASADRRRAAGGRVPLGGKRVGHRGPRRQAAPPRCGMAGVRMALGRGQGRTARAPIRSTLVGATVAVAAVATALTFTASLDRLLTTPRLYGQSWEGPVRRRPSAPRVGDAVVAA